MIVTIIGAGNGGTTVAADLKLKGHSIRLLKTSNTLHNEHYKYLKENNGKITLVENEKSHTVYLDMVTTNFEKAITGSDLIIIYIQTNYHEELIKKIIPFLESNQIVLLEPGYLSTAYFLKYDSEFKYTVVEAQSSPIDCRITRPGTVNVLFRNVRNPVAIYQNEQNNINLIQEQLNDLQYNFVYLQSIIEAAIHNPNLIVHTVGGIMSTPRIEFTKGDYWMYREVFTPRVWNLVEQLDEEKMSVLEKIGARKLSYVDACKYRNSEDLELNSKDIFFDYALNNSPKGPESPDSRFITEDVPEGLVLLESLGEMTETLTPTCSGLIDIANALLRKDFRKKGRTIDKLGKDNITKLIELNMTVMEK